MPQPGYPLPDGQLGEDEIVCQLVYLPDRPEYWQALLGALHYITTWRAWERDDDKRGKNAAANWREAFELTMECWRMTCLDDLKDNVAAILQLLQNQNPCCNENITYYDSDTYITIIVPGDGDAPDFYGETAVSDWEEWREYLCHNANLWVDELIRASNTLDSALSTGGITIAVVAALMTAIAFFTVGGVLALPFLMTTLFAITTTGSAAIYSASATDIENARDDIVCAILSGRDIASVIEASISLIAWETLYEVLDYDSAMAILYEGGNGDDEFLEAELDDSCACLCLHMWPHDNHPNVTVYQSAIGAQWTMDRHTTGGFDNTISGSISFNYEAGVDFCGSMKVIDSISVSDGLSFSRITTKDQDNNDIDDYYNGFPDCTEPIGQLVGDTCARIFLLRHQVPDGGCGTGDITITMTYHDAP